MRVELRGVLASLFCFHRLPICLLTCLPLFSLRGLLIAGAIEWFTSPHLLLVLLFFSLAQLLPCCLSTLPFHSTTASERAINHGDQEQGTYAVDLGAHHRLSRSGGTAGAVEAEAQQDHDRLREGGDQEH